MDIEEEFLQITSSNQWNFIFKKLQNESIPIQNSGTFDVAMSPENRSFNRYRNVLPYDHNRIILNEFPINYINASLIYSEELPSQKYIFTQGPLDITSSHFWLMVWQRKCPGIIMLNKIIENYAVKCHPYFPENVSDIILFKDVNLSVECVKMKMQDNYVHRIIQITNLNSMTQCNVEHFNFTEWPDFDAPKNPSDFLDFLSAVWLTGCIDENGTPSIVHCSAGIGRSGTFALIDLTLKLIQKKKTLCDIDIKKIVKDLRSCRPGVIQSPEQLKFCYLAIIAGAKRFGLDGEHLSNNHVVSREPEMSFQLNNETTTTTENNNNIISHGVLREGDESLTHVPHHLSDPAREVPEKVTPKTLLANHDKHENATLSSPSSDFDEDEKLIILSNSSLSNSDLEMSNDENETNKDKSTNPDGHEKLVHSPNQSSKIINVQENEEESEKSSLDPVTYLKVPRSINESDFEPRESFKTLTDYYTYCIERRMKMAKMKIRQRRTPLVIRRLLEPLLVRSEYIKSTKHFFQIFSVLSAIFILLLSYYVKINYYS